MPNGAQSSPVADRIVTGLAKVGLALRTQAWQQAGPLGLSPTQAQILALLAARPGALRTVSALAAELGITPPTACDAIRVLEHKKLLRKARGRRDARVRHLALTPVGRALASQISQWPEFLAQAVHALAPDEQAVFLRGLSKMIRTLQLAGRIPVARMCITCTYFRPHAYPDPAQPHHCDFVQAPFGDGELRLDCRDHQPAASQPAAEAWHRFVQAGPGQTVPDGGSRTNTDPSDLPPREPSPRSVS